MTDCYIRVNKCVGCSNVRKPIWIVSLREFVELKFASLCFGIGVPDPISFLVSIEDTLTRWLWEHLTWSMGHRFVNA